MNKTKLYTSLLCIVASASGLSAAELRFDDGLTHDVDWTQLVAGNYVNPSTFQFNDTINTTANSTVNLSLAGAGQAVTMTTPNRLFMVGANNANGGGNIRLVDGDLIYTSNQPINVGEQGYTGPGKTTSSFFIANGASFSNAHNMNIAQNASHIATATIEGTYKFIDTVNAGRTITVGQANDSTGNLYLQNGGIIDGTALVGTSSYAFINVGNASNTNTLFEIDGPTSKVIGRVGFQMSSGGIVNSTSVWNIKNGGSFINSAETMPGGLNVINGNAKSSTATINLTDKSILSLNNSNALRIGHGAGTTAAEGNTATINVLSGSTFTNTNAVEFGSGKYNTAIINVDGKSSDGQASSVNFNSLNSAGAAGAKAIINVTNGGQFTILNATGVNNSTFVMLAAADADSKITVSGADSSFNVYSSFTANAGSVLVENGGLFLAARNVTNTTAAATFVAGTSLTVTGKDSLFNANTVNFETAGTVLVSNGGKLSANESTNSAFYQTGGTTKVVGASKIEAIGKFNCVSGVVTLSLTNANTADDMSLAMIDSLYMNFVAGTTLNIDGTNIKNQDGAIYLLTFIDLSYNDVVWDSGAIDINDFVSSFASIYGFDTDLYGDVTLDDLSIEDLGGKYALVLNLNLVPEPSTYAAIFGILALAFALYRRRK